ncbi:hypothetical protein GIB67_035469 [Kingdonia uniflora]|uniref:Glycosyl transferase family 1 domain-containing protein n=1 Tax=Kingdonia uniflora TaxID=39325 RepID=A0A7J7P0E4_9MAGN|nr:hypothetical protein GIB67_035469 [Kingdonia uniflora]
MDDKKELRLSSLRPSGGLKSTPRGGGGGGGGGSPSLRRLHSSRTPRRDGRGSGSHFQWVRSNRLLLWLILITLWAYLGFYVQSKWAHGDNNKEEFIGYKSKSRTLAPNLVTNEDIPPVNNSTSEKGLDMKKINVSLAKKGNGVSSRRTMSSRKSRKLRGKPQPKEKIVLDGGNNSLEEQEEDIPKKNTTYGLLLGPFGSIEDKVLGWSPEKRSGTCDRTGEFRRLVWSRRFVLIFHGLSLTGAPISMMELATELMSCGATVFAVVLSKKGGLMKELSRRKINVLEDKVEQSYKTATKADLVIAGSALCASWIEQYTERYPASSGQIAWWIMENRREYFNRSKLMLNQVKMLIFLSESQSKQWLAWCEEEGIKLRFPTSILPLSVNDELAFVAGIPSSLNTPSFSVEKMLERRQLLREAVREEMGLTDNDMLVMSLSSINPGKGQLLLLESAVSVVLEESITKASAIKENISGGTVGLGRSTLAIKKRSKRKKKTKSPPILYSFGNHTNNMTLDGSHNKSTGIPSLNSSSNNVSLESSQKNTGLPNLGSSSNYTNNVTLEGSQKKRKMVSDNEGMKEQTLKVLIGSVGSLSNKVVYVKGLLGFLSQHPELSKRVLWTLATTRVASLYAAADVYIMNSQGIGETFGRVTVEAMAYGLPVLGTDAGGTTEIVENNVTGLLHPVGRPGNRALAKNLLYLLKNPSERERMGIKGREKVEKMYLKRQMYQKFGGVLIKCMRVK